MIGTILVKNLNVHCIIGILPKERTTEQDVYVDLEVDYDFEQARKSEDIQYALDYTSIADAVKQLIISKKYQLIETAVEEVSALLFERWPIIIKCSVQIKKPDAIPEADFTAVKITRKNKSV